MKGLLKITFLLFFTCEIFILILPGSSKQDVSKQQATKTTQDQSNKTASSSTSRNVTSPNAPPGFAAISHQQDTNQEPHANATQASTLKQQGVPSAIQDCRAQKPASKSARSQSPSIFVEQKSASNTSQDWRMKKKASGNPVRSQSPSTSVEQKKSSSGNSITARPGLSLAQTIAAQVSERFDDDAKSTCSSKSSISMKTARCTSSSASMHTAHEGDISRKPSKSTRGRRSHQQDRGIRNRNASQSSHDKGSQDGHSVDGRPSSSVLQALPPLHHSTDQNDSLLLAMSYIINPSEFYIHPITRNIRKLDFLQDELNVGIVLIIT